MTPDPLVAFLTERLNETEAAAEAATPGPWTAVPYVYGPPEDGWGEPGNWEIKAPGRTVVSHQSYEGGGIDRAADAAHIARHDPARVLRDVAADRKLIDGCQRAQADRPSSEWESDYTQALEWAVMVRAERFSDHPDYRQEWKP